MSRVIKFRAWDERNHVMVAINDLYWFEENGVLEMDPSGVYQGHSGDYRLMQFTGLVDSNGYPIFEGDIVDILHTTGTKPNIYKVKYLVMWSDDKARYFFRSLTINRLTQTVSPWKLRASKAIVIGNMHQNAGLLDDNPNLLKGGDEARV